MAKTLESPVEPRALNYLTYAFLVTVNTVWAWIAAVTAAFSFRASSSSPGVRARNDVASTSSAPETEKCVSDRNPVFEMSGGGKTKIRMCYAGGGEFCGEDESEEELGGEIGAWVSGGLRRFSENWERDMAMADLGWHRWVDTAVLDGSVVRLWEYYI